jgi:phage terminase large subunit GpA-like protein
MLAVTEPGVHVITAMVGTQILKTSLLENVFGYHAHLDPCPALLVQPKDEAAEQFSKERITPMIRATPVLRQLVGTTRMRSGDESLTYKPFPGGFLALVGAGSPDNLARRPVRIVMYDEVDKYTATREGDPIALGDERCATFVNWLSLRVCSPTIEDESRIAASYADSDRRKASVECPHCQHRQFLDFFKHVNWDKDGNVHRPKTARVSCESCGTIWSEGERLRSLQTIRWHQTKPFLCCDVRHVPLDLYDVAWQGQEAEPVVKIWDWWAAERHAIYRVKCPLCDKWGVDNEHAGFQCSKLYSPWPKDSPASIAEKWLAAKDEEGKKQAWWNTQLGLPFKIRATRELEIDALAARGEQWPAEVPDGVAVITAGVDVQDYRLEVEVTGWGRDEESWSLAYEVFEGSPSTPDPWKKLDDFLKKIWKRADGRQYAVEGVCIDSGGHHTQRVYEFCRARLGRRIWAIKGESARGGERNPVWPTRKVNRRSKQGFRPFVIGVNAAKDLIHANLHKEVVGPGFMHFKADRDVSYYMQLTAERVVVKVVGGKKFRVWEQIPGRANEAFDCRVYSYAALCGLIYNGLRLNQRCDEIAAQANYGGQLPIVGVGRPATAPERRIIKSPFVG